MTMGAGDWHVVGDLKYQETLHGPFLGRDCVDCGGFCVAVPDYPSPRCERCFQKHMDVPPSYARMAGRIRPATWLNPVGLGHAPAPEFNWTWDE